MIRKAFVTEVLPGKIDEYEKVHNPIWRELQDILNAHGIHNYSIFYHRATNQLFSYMEIEDEQKFNRIAESEVCQKWWLRMKKYLVSESADTPKAKEAELREVFHLASDGSLSIVREIV